MSLPAFFDFNIIKGIYCATFIALAAISFLFLQRAEAVRIGRFEFLADLSVGREYDDNVFLTAVDEKKNDRILIVQPAISLTRETRKVTLNAHGKADLRFYHENKSEDQYHKTGAFHMELKPTTKLNIGIQAQDTFSHLKRDERERPLAENKIKLNNLSIMPYIRQRIGKKAEVTFRYTYSERDYRDEDLIIDANGVTTIHSFEDSRNHSGTANFVYKIGHDIALEAGYRYTTADFDRMTPDYTEQEFNGGLTWDIESMIRISGRFGRAWKEYTDPNESDQKYDYPTIRTSLDIYSLKATVINAVYTKSSNYVSPHDSTNDSFTSHDVSLTINHDIFDRKVGLSYGGVYNKSDYELIDREEKSHTKTVQVVWNPLEPIRLSLKYDRGYSKYFFDSVERVDETEERVHKTEERVDETEGKEIGLRWSLGKPMVLILNYKFMRSTYDLEDREDEFRGVNAHLAYTISKNISFKIRYEYQENRSSDQYRLHVEDNEYKNNKYSINLGVIF